MLAELLAHNTASAKAECCVVLQQLVNVCMPYGVTLTLAVKDASGHDTDQ